jgi:hypothetical protein
VLAGVPVIGLDDIAEHERRAAVGASELEQALEPAPALMTEQDEQAQQRN